MRSLRRESRERSVEGETSAAGEGRTHEGDGGPSHVEAEFRSVQATDKDLAFGGDESEERDSEGGFPRASPSYDGALLAGLEGMRDIGEYLWTVLRVSGSESRDDEGSRGRPRCWKDAWRVRAQC